MRPSAARAPPKLSAANELGYNCPRIILRQGAFPALLNLAAIATPGARLFRGGQNGCLPRIAAVCAALALLAVIIGGGMPSAAHADGGVSARNKSSASAPDDSGATPQAYAQRILHALTDHDTNNWVRYWQARAACDSAAARHAPAAAHLDRFLIALTTTLCAQLDARLGVNPAAHMPRGEERTVGLLLNEPDAAVGYTLLTSEKNRDVFLIDPLGRVAHSWHTPDRVTLAKLLDNGSLLVNMSPGVVEFDPRGNKIWEYKIDRHHHDFIKMPNGNVMIIARWINTREEAIAAGANPEFVHEVGLDADYLVEVRPTGASGGEIVWKWSAWDHLIQDFDPTKPNYGAVAEHPELIDLNFLLETTSERRPEELSDRLFDWLHVNSVDYNPELDQIMLSPRNFSELWIIDHSATMEEARGHSGGNSGMGGDLLYRWGNPRAYGHGTLADQRLFWQHQTHWIPPGLPGAGNILLFNNGLEFAGDERHYSSVDEFAPPADGYRRAPNSPYPPLAPEWTYAAETPADFYAPIMSGAQRLPNGNTFIVNGPAGTIFQATPDGRIAWKYIVPLHKRARLRQGERAVEAKRSFPTPYGDPVPSLTNSVYRAYWYPPDHPGLRALDLTPGAFIEDTPDIYDITHKAIIAGDFGERLSGSVFDIYLDKNGSEDGDEYRRSLIYFKRPCAAADTQARFFLHIIPVDARDLPAAGQEHGFDNMDFNFTGIDFQALDDWCVAIAPLPRYAIERIRTGQFTGEGGLWRADIELGE